MNGQHGVNVVPVVGRAKSSVRGYATNQSVQQITEDAKEIPMSMLTVMLDVVQVSRPAIQASTQNNIEVDKCTVLAEAGYWSSWSSWSGCSVSCGYGQQRRQRTCHEPECGGKGCYGSKYSAKACYIACSKKRKSSFTGIY